MHTSRRIDDRKNQSMCSNNNREKYIIPQRNSWVGNKIYVKRCVVFECDTESIESVISHAHSQYREKRK